MKHLISNTLNEKSIISNILSNRLNKVIILTGTYGVGKTEFATQIGRMLTCVNLTESGYCGECESCQREISNGISGFNTPIHLLNMEKVTYDEMLTLVGQATGKIRNSNEVYIFDEFHLVDKKAQELWLAETAKLEDCYIILTTTDKKSISDGIVSRSIQIPMKTLATVEASKLIKENYPDATNEVVNAITRRASGSPRELINLSNFYMNSSLTTAEILEHLSDNTAFEVVMCLESLMTREVFFDSIKQLRTLSSYTVKKSLQDILWDWLGDGVGVRDKMDYLSPFSTKQIMKYLVLSNEDPFLTILKMFKDVTVQDKPNKDFVATQSQTVAVVEAKEEFKKEEGW